jgi:hypothetical protein
MHLNFLVGMLSTSLSFAFAHTGTMAPHGPGGVCAFGVTVCYVLALIPNKLS